MGYRPSIIQIDNVLVSEDILTEYFACDYEKCKGACCIIGDSGAPLEEGEDEAIEKNYAHFEPLMTEKGKKAVAEKGFFEIDRDGDCVTPLVADSEECAYCYFEDATDAAGATRGADATDAAGAGSGKKRNCLCAMECQWLKGIGNFRKPISCQLYPIRLTHLDSGMIGVNLHRWDICKDAFAKGRAEGIKVYQFLREPIVRYFGEDFYQALCEAEKFSYLCSEK